ncbi:MAG: hypothetical protein DWP98_09770 [Bacteroidetes bacterium]|nr:MAG: hypothetical protein DWP98_09770 [Bacteroidota bacterium]MBL1145902.1 hypothetical protein [Bacteroidota bacterium]NOG58696.1 hypothetical protein [Bacteroidota bacterium]
MKLKHKIFELFSILVISLTLTSCAKEESYTINEYFNPTVKQNVSDIVNSNASFSAKVDGNTFNVVSFRGRRIGNVMGVVAYSANDSLWISTTNVTPGTYLGAVDGKNGVYLSESNGTYSSTFNSPVDATIDITNYNSSSKTVSGTFSGTAKLLSTQQTKRITNGKFNNVVLVQENSNANFGNMTATIGGQNFQSYACVAVSTGGQTVITATNTGATKSITIQLGSPLTVQTYTLDNTNYISYFENLTSGTPDTYGSNIGSGSGTLTISRVDNSAKLIEGTFSFTGANLVSGGTINVTNGVFTASIR